GVVANAAVQDCSWQRAIPFIERDRVVAVLPGNGDQAGIDDRGGAARDGHGPAVDENIPGGVPAGCDRVVEIVADRAQHAGNGIKAAGDSHGLSFRRSVAARRRISSASGTVVPASAQTAGLVWGATAGFEPLQDVTAARARM